MGVERAFKLEFGGGFAYKFFMSDSMRLKDQPASERPRERLVAQGADALSNAELIAILLRTGLKGMNAVEVGKHLLSKFGSVQSLALASVDDLRQVKGIGRDKALTLVAAFALAHKMARELQEESPLLDNPENVVRLLRANGVDVPVVVGGIIPEADQLELLAAGVARVYTPKDFRLSDIVAELAELVAVPS